MKALLNVDLQNDFVEGGALAKDYGVKFTALDAVDLGFHTHLIVDANRAVNLQPDAGERAVEEMCQAGVEIPAGLSGDHQGAEQEELVEAARRKLLEETGYRATTMKWLFEGPSSAGLTTETGAFFLSCGLGYSVDCRIYTAFFLSRHRIGL